jgi:hypothetical protein
VQHASLKKGRQGGGIPRLCFSPKRRGCVFGEARGWKGKEGKGRRGGYDYYRDELEKRREIKKGKVESSRDGEREAEVRDGHSKRVETPARKKKNNFEMSGRRAAQRNSRGAWGRERSLGIISLSGDDPSSKERGSSRDSKSEKEKRDRGGLLRCCNFCSSLVFPLHPSHAPTRKRQTKKRKKAMGVGRLKRKQENKGNKKTNTIYDVVETSLESASEAATGAGEPERLRLSSSAFRAPSPG